MGDLIGSNGGFQDLIGQNSAQLIIETDDLIVNDSVQLLYADPNSNLVTDSKQNVITEPKDSFVDVPNQITWSQNVRQFTASLPQDIATTSNPTFNNLQLDGKLTVEQGIESKGDIDASGQNITCERLDATSKAFVGQQSGGGGGTFTPKFITPNNSSNVTISTTTTTDDTITGTSSNLRRGGLGDVVFSNTDSMDIIFDVITTVNNNLWLGIASSDYTQTDVDAGTNPNTIAQDYIYYINSNGNITGNFVGAPIGTGINIASGDRVRIVLTGGNLLYYFDTGTGFGAPIAVNNIDANNYRLLIWDGNTQVSNFQVVMSGTITTGAPPLVEKDLTVNGESLFYDNVYLDGLTGDKNLVLDSNKIIQIEDRDSFVNTNNIFWIQNGRQFTAETVQDIQPTSSITFNNLFLGNNLTLQALSAYDVLYLNSNSEVRGIRLNDDEVLVGTPTDPVAQTKSSFYELHQNPIGSKWDSERKAPNISIFEDGLSCQKANDTSRGRILCINYFDSPRTATDFSPRFGFEILDFTGLNLNIGFIPNTAELQNSLYGDAGNYCYTNGGNIYENGVFITGGVGSYTTGDIIEYQIRTDNKYEIYKNGELKYTSSATIVNGQFYPQVFDQSTNISSFKVAVYQTYRGTVNTRQVILSNDGTTNAPAISFSNNLTGFYSPTTLQLTFVSANTDRLFMDFDKIAPSVNNNYNLGDISNYFSNGFITTLNSDTINNNLTINTNTLVASNQLTQPNNTSLFTQNGTIFLAGGTGKILFSGLGNRIEGHTFNDETNPPYCFNSTAGRQTGMYFKATSPYHIKFTVNGDERLRITEPENNGEVSPNPPAQSAIPGPEKGLLLGNSGRRWKRLYALLPSNIGSDRRYKQDIKPLDNCLDKIMELNPVEYKMNNEKYMGLIAQEVEETKLNCCVEYDEKEDEYSMTYTELIAPMIKAIQELKIALVGANTEIQNLKNEIEILKS